MVRVGAPGAVTVILPVRWPPVLLVMLSQNEPLFVPLAGETVSQLTLLDTDHALLEVTPMLSEFAAEVGAHEL